MASLELLVDAGGVLRGSSDARTGLDQIIDKAYEAEDATGRLSQTMTVTGASAREAWGASRGGLEIAKGISQTAVASVQAAAGVKDYSSALFAASTALSSLSRTSEDWRNLSTAMATVRTVSKEVVHDQFGIAVGMRDVVSTQHTAVTGWSALWSVIKANPLTAIVTGLSAAAAAVSLFSSKTREASVEWKSFGDAMSNAQAGIIASQQLGLPAGDFISEQQRNQFRALQQAVRVRQPMSVTDLGAVSGSNTEVVRLLAQRGDANAAHYLKYGEFQDGFYESNVMGTKPRYTDDLSRMMVPVDAQRQYLDLTYRYYERKASEAKAGSASIDGPGLLEHKYGIPFDPMGLRQSPFGVEISPDQQLRVDFENTGRARGENLKANTQALQEQLQLAREIGNTLGDAAWEFASGMRSGREVIAGLLSETGRGLLRQGMAQLTQQIITSFSGGK